MRPLDFTDPRTTPFVEPRSRGELPHLYKEGGSYFVTFRLRDAVTPAYERILELDRMTWVKPFSKVNAAKISSACDAPLRLGSCVLGQSAVARIVQDALLHFADVRYQLPAWCVMPNHVHVIFTPWQDFGPSDILHSWKSFTAKRAKELVQGDGSFWQREYYDHLLRSVGEFERAVRYVLENPVKARLREWRRVWVRGRDALATAGGTPALQSGG